MGLTSEQIKVLRRLAEDELRAINHMVSVVPETKRYLADNEMAALRVLPGAIAALDAIIPPGEGA